MNETPQKKPEQPPGSPEPAGASPPSAGHETSGARTPAAQTAWQQWLASPPGQYVMGWEAAEIAPVVADLFGYYAVQLGLPELDALAANRMPHRYRVDRAPQGPAEQRIDLRVAHFGELPFETQSIDLVVLAHQLEFSADPHQLLREVDRILRPEGRLVVVGFNPLSLWGLRQVARRGGSDGFVPIDASMLGVPRVRDWLKLLSFEIDENRYGCYAPPCRTARWLERSRVLESAGDRWWPICGAVYLLSAVKRVQGMRLVGPAWRRRSAPKAAPAVAISGRSACNRESAAILPLRRRP